MQSAPSADDVAVTDEVLSDDEDMPQSVKQKQDQKKVFALLVFPRSQLLRSAAASTTMAVYAAAHAGAGVVLVVCESQIRACHKRAAAIVELAICCCCWCWCWCWCCSYCRTRAKACGTKLARFRQTAACSEQQQTFDSSGR